MPKKLMKCIRKVKEKMRKGGKKVNPYAICIAATGQKPHRKKRRK